MFKFINIVRILALINLLLLLGFEIKAQTDKEFWFTVPDVTIRHNYPGGVLAYFKFANGNKWDATVTISMPANPYNPVTKTGFKDSVFTIPKYSFKAIDVTKFILAPYPWSTQGVLFNYNLASSTYTKKHNFTGGVGNDPYGSVIEATNNKLYGMAYNGGANNFGVIFEYDPATSTYTKKFDFTGNAGTKSGGNPYGSLVQASNGKLYGMTNSGGNNNFGTIFEYDITTSTFTKKFDFTGNAGTQSGGNPFGSLIQASNGKLYGMTYSGGVNNVGVIFEYDITTSSFVKRLDFTGNAGTKNGGNPYGSLLQASNGKLYGITSRGGNNNVGVIFDFDPTTFAYAKRLDLAAAANGSNSYGSLIQASNGLLYGMTNIGGANNLGVIFEFNPTSFAFTKKYDFVAGITGRNPYGSLMQASNGMFYGMTCYGGASIASNMGVIFEFDPTTSVYTKKFDFPGNNNGNNPYYGNLMQTASGQLYGMTIGFAQFPAIDDINLMENKPLTPSGINKFGLKITSDLEITAYFESGNVNNKDIFALKGKNALGTEFWTPFQTLSKNQTFATPNEAYSSIDVVATQNNTIVTFKLPAGLQAAYGQPETVLAAGATFTRTLQLGESFCLFPPAKNVDPTKRLVGTKITSTKPIAVSIKDDSDFHTPANSGSYDLQGDQLIPKSIIGKEYAVINTGLSTGGVFDDLYVLTTENNTIVTIDGVVYPVIANAGTQKWVQFPAIYATKPFIRVIADKPVYVWHVGGFGGEGGGAILPPIDKCTGSTRVAFTRSYNEPFFIMLMVRKGAETGFYRTIGTDTTKRALPAITWYDINPTSNWLVGKIDASSTAAANFPVGVHTFVNTMDIFHLAIINGSAAGGCFFGYFSNFNVFNPGSMVVETGGAGNILCYGDSAQLYASGGTKYNWTPSDFLDNTFISDPVARNITKSLTYSVTVSGACGLSETRSLDIIVGPPMEAKFTTDVFSGCAPLVVSFDNTSTGVTRNYWDLNTDGDWSDPGEGEINLLNFSKTFDNLTNDTIRYYITLSATDASSSCFREVTKSILVYPRVQASLSTTIVDALHCHPLPVTFVNSSTVNGSTYSWDFGDGGSSYLTNPVHTYNNFNLGVTTYNGSLLVTDKYNNCKVTAPFSVTVQPYIKASFVVDKVEGCSPFLVNVVDDSQGGFNQSFWDRDGNGVDDYSAPGSWSLTYTNPTVTNAQRTVPIRLTVKNAAGCPSVITRNIIVDPPVTASFATDNHGNPLGCPPLNVDFASTTTNATLYHWLIDATAIDNQTTAGYTFENFGAAPVTKTVSFTASNVYGCSAVVNQNVIVQPLVNADIAIDQEVGCSPLNVTFLNTSSIGATAFQWDIDNNGSVEFVSKNILPQIFTNPSVALGVTIVPVKLTARNAAGCVDDIVRNITVNPQSTVNFIYADNGNANHCSPLITNFTSTTTNTETFQWEFGTLGASTIANPNFTFSNDGVIDYTVPVTLHTNNTYGCSASTSQNIIVRPGVKALFSLDKTAGCTPYDVNVSATTSAAIINYTWDFDGTAFTGPIQLFSNPTNRTGLDVTKNIKLTVSSGFCSNDVTKSIVTYPEIEARLSALPALAGCSPLTVNFQSSSALYGTGTSASNVIWDFNDNSSSISATDSHVFTNTDNTVQKQFNIKLTATSARGCVDDTTFVVSVNPSVNAAFNAQIIKQCTPMQIQILDASAAGPTISTYSWNFNGGTPAVPPNNTNFVVDYTNPDPENPVNRTITLNVNNTFGCTSSTSQTFTIDPQVIAGISIAAPLTGGGVPIDKLCAPASFTFKNGSTGGTLTYTWDFNDGDVQTIFNRNNTAHLFENRSAATKKFDVKLTVKNTKGCTDNATQSVFAYPEVDSKFSMARDSACAPFFIKIEDKSLNGTQWSWDFGHTILGVPQTKTSAIPGEVFTQLIDNEAPGTIKNYKINLKLDDLTTGCWDTISQFIEVYPRIVSNFAVTPQNGCNPVSITFTNNSTGLNNTTILGSSIWELDNGLSFNQTTPPNLNINNPSTINERIVNVKLTTINSLGCKSIISKTITVAPDVRASFTASILEGCDPFTADFSNLTPSVSYNYSWTVNGVQESTNQDFNSRLFLNKTNPPVINTYQVQLKSSYVNNVACFDVMNRVITVNPRVYPNFQIVNNEACHPLVTNIVNGTASYNNLTQYTWDLGNGTFSSLKDLNNLQYKNNSSTKDSTFSIKLIANSVHQCVDSVTKSLTVHPRPIASFIMNTESLACSPFPVSLTDSSSGVNLNYTFNLGDGTIINNTNKYQTINHTYHNLTPDVQPYVISLKTVTAFGCENNTSQTIYSYPEVNANFAFNPGNAACSPFSVSLNNLSQNAYFYEWSFDDLTNSNLMSPTHRFVNITENDKVFNIHLKSISEYDCNDTITIPLTVYATPVANFSVNPPLKIYPDATFNFHNQSRPAADSWTYSWTFGDGYTSSLKEAGDHTYAKWGPKANDFIYKSTLRVENSHCWDTTSNLLRLLPAQPIPFFTADIYESCSPLEAHFINASQFGSNYNWDFGDGVTTTIDEPIHTFTVPGYYNVKLSVFGDGGETYYYKSFRVFQNPIADFAVFPNKVMLPDAEVHVYNLSKFGSRYEWDLGDGTLTSDKDPVHKYSDLGEYRISLTAYAPDSLGACQDFVSKFPAVYVEGVGYCKFPDAFIPNKKGSNGGVYDDIDYKNEVFHPVHYGVVDYKLMIFNRWGEQIFQSNDVKVGWDGYFQGRLCDQGVYIWRAIGRYTNGKIFDKKGNLTLLR